MTAMAAFTPPASGQTSLPAGYAALIPVMAANWQETAAIAATADSLDIFLPLMAGFADTSEIGTLGRFDDAPQWVDPPVRRFRLMPDIDPTIDVALHTQAAGLIDAMATVSASANAEIGASPVHSFHALPVAVSPLAL